jgi:hypothetical protein
MLHADSEALLNCGAEYVHELADITHLKTAQTAFKPKEYFYFHCLRNWERTAPSYGRVGTLDGRPVENTQTARMARLLTITLAGKADIDGTFQKLSKRTQRKKDGNSYVSKDKSWMKEPYDGISKAA